MIMKIKCKECRAVYVVKKDTLKEARNTKKDYKGYLCGTCTFKMLANKTAKEIVGRFKRYDRYGQTSFNNL